MGTAVTRIAIIACASACSTFTATAASDGGVADASPDVVIGTDGSSGGPSPPSCVGATMLARDAFDHKDTLLVPPWTSIDGVKPSIDGANGQPAPSLVSTSSAVTPGAQETFSRLVFNVAAEPPSYCVELDMLAQGTSGAFDTTGFAELLALESQQQDDVYIEMLPTGLNLSVGAKSRVLDWAGGSWNHVVLRATRSGNVTTYKATVAPVGASVSLDASPVDMLGPLTVSLGVHVRGGAPSVSLYADNFVMTAP